MVTADARQQYRQHAEFYFARLEYTGYRDNTYIKNWYTDYPNADEHIVAVINRVTGIKSGTAKALLGTGDIFQYPFVYIVEPAQLRADDTEVAELRAYLDRGGFLFLDDIHGDADLVPVKELLARIFPETDALAELDTSHELFHIFYDIDFTIQVVNDNIALCVTCQQWENGPSGEVPQVLAHYNDAGNMDVLIMYNNDLGDGVEWADSADYPREMAVFSFKMFVNSVLFALTH